MTQEQVDAIYTKMEKMADDLGEHAEDIVILAVISHDEDQPMTRQMLHVGRGNFWARLGMAGMYFLNKSVNMGPEVEPKKEEEK